MQQLPTKAYNDGFVRGDNRSIGNFVPHTAAYTMGDYDAGDIHTNKGASGSVTITLPTPKEGRVCRFLKQTQQNVVITATSAAKINGGAAGGTYTNSTAENLKFVELVSDGTDWFVKETNGTWATA